MWQKKGLSLWLRDYVWVWGAAGGVGVAALLCWCVSSQSESGKYHYSPLALTTCAYNTDCALKWSQTAQNLLIMRLKLQKNDIFRHYNGVCLDDFTTLMLSYSQLPQHLLENCFSRTGSCLLLKQVLTQTFIYYCDTIKSILKHIWIRCVSVSLGQKKSGEFV